MEKRTLKESLRIYKKLNEDLMEKILLILRDITIRNVLYYAKFRHDNHKLVEILNDEEDDSDYVLRSELRMMTTRVKEIEELEKSFDGKNVFNKLLLSKIRYDELLADNNKEYILSLLKSSSELVESIFDKFRQFDLAPDP